MNVAILRVPIRLHEHMGPSVCGCQMTSDVAIELVSIARPKGSTPLLANGLSRAGKTLGFAAQSLMPRMDIGPLPVRDDSLGVWPALD